MILNAKEKYFKRLGRKLSDPNEGIKSYWLSQNFQAKATLLNDFFVKLNSAVLYQQKVLSQIFGPGVTQFLKLKRLTGRKWSN